MSDSTNEENATKGKPELIRIEVEETRRYPDQIVRGNGCYLTALILDEWDTRIWRVVWHYVGRAVKKRDLSGQASVGIDVRS